MLPDQPSNISSRPPPHGEIEQFSPTHEDLFRPSTTRPDPQIASAPPLPDASAEHVADLELGLGSCSTQVAAPGSVEESVMGPRPSSQDRELVMKQAQEGLNLKEYAAGDCDDDDEDGQCRVCHLVCDVELGTTETMQLGCHCKDDLGIAHRNCAEAWFKIKGNRICEICGATAENIVGNEDPNFMEQWNDADMNDSSEPQARCWQSLSLCNFFLACMVVTFILLWLFRVTIS